LALLFNTLRALGVRYVIGFGQLPLAETMRLPSIGRGGHAMKPPRVARLEVDDVKYGSYSPSSPNAAHSAADTVAALRVPEFHFSNQCSLCANRLVSRRRMRREHVSGGVKPDNSCGSDALLRPSRHRHLLRLWPFRATLSACGFSDIKLVQIRLTGP
jgi:hypothetical protein